LLLLFRLPPLLSLLFAEARGEGPPRLARWLVVCVGVCHGDAGDCRAALVGRGDGGGMTEGMASAAVRARMKTDEGGTLVLGVRHGRHGALPGVRKGGGERGETCGGTHGRVGNGRSPDERESDLGLVELRRARWVATWMEC